MKKEQLNFLIKHLKELYPDRLLETEDQVKMCMVESLEIYDETALGSTYPNGHHQINIYRINYKTRSGLSNYRYFGIHVTITYSDNKINYYDIKEYKKETIVSYRWETKK